MSSSQGFRKIVRDYNKLGSQELATRASDNVSRQRSQKMGSLSHNNNNNNLFLDSESSTGVPKTRRIIINNHSMNPSSVPESATTSPEKSGSNYSGVSVGSGVYRRTSAYWANRPQQEIYPSELVLDIRSQLGRRGEQNYQQQPKQQDYYQQVPLSHRPTSDFQPFPSYPVYVSDQQNSSSSSSVPQQQQTNTSNTAPLSGRISNNYGANLVNNGSSGNNQGGRERSGSSASNPANQPRISANTSNSARMSSYELSSRNPHNPVIVSSPEAPLTRAHFTLEYVVGKGGFGKVWRVREKKTGKIFAMKEMLKSKIIAKKSVDSVMNQNRLLQRLAHPFLVNMTYAFQDKQNLYLVMEYVNGGDLRYHLGNRRRFLEAEAKFFIACIIVGLQYLHMNSIIHRDIKPENLVFDEQGYLRITDLGVSREWRPNNASDTSGTPGYMAPEVITKNNHTFTADFFAVGVIAYELMLGKRPYTGRSRKEIRDQILAKQAKIDEPLPGWSPESVDFINRMLLRKQENRLGANGILEVKHHKWFNRFDWGLLQKKLLVAPFQPKTIEEDYDKYKQCISEDSQTGQDQESRLLLRDPNAQALFEGYSYKSPQNTHIEKLEDFLMRRNFRPPSDSARTSR